MTGPSESASTDSPYADRLAEKGLLYTHREYLRTYLRGQVHKEAVLSEMGLPPMAYSMVRTDRYKMSVNTLTREPLDLYDMENDPNELHNRVDDPALVNVRRELLDGHLDRLLSRMDTTQIGRAHV